MDYLNSGRTKKINWLIFSFEMSHETLLTKLLSIYLYEKYRRVVSYSDILSFNGKLNDDKYNLILQSKQWLEEFMSLCTIIDYPVNADGLYAICANWTKNFGTYSKPDEFGRIKYIPNDPERYMIVTVDHIGLLATKESGNIKKEMDDACERLINLRNRCKLTVYIIQQLNRNFKSMDRRTAGGGNWSGLQLDDFSGSSGPVQAAEQVIGIYFPWREKIAKIGGYDVGKLKDRCRIISILKNRFGQSDKNVATVFFGENGLWRELPQLDKDGKMDEDAYENYLKLY